MAIVVSRSGEGGCVACGCAESSSGCCLYPWPDPDNTSGSGPYYPPEDLPDTLEMFDLFSGALATTFYHIEGTYKYGDRSGDGGVDAMVLLPAVPAEDEYYGVYPGNYWATYYTDVHGEFGGKLVYTGTGIGVGDTGGSHSCLANEDAYGSTNGVRAPFSDTYTVNGTDTITRGEFPGVCTWTGPKTGGGTWTLDYGITTPYAFHLKSTGASSTSDIKADPQNKPDGAYGSNTVA